MTWKQIVHALRRMGTQTGNAVPDGFAARALRRTAADPNGTPAETGLADAPPDTPPNPAHSGNPAPPVAAAPSQYRPTAM